MQSKYQKVGRFKAGLFLFTDNHAFANLSSDPYGLYGSLAGTILTPGGVAILIVMPVVGRLITWVNSKAIIVCGISVTTWSTYLIYQCSTGQRTLTPLVVGSIPI